MSLKADHHGGLVLSGAGLVGSIFAWFLEYIEAINSVMHFFVLSVSLAAAIVGLRKLLK